MSNQEIVKVEEPVKEVLETVKVSERRVYWHKACKNLKESTITKMKVDDVLTYTLNTSTDPQGNVKEVLSLARGKRIYYLIDYTLDELTIAKNSFNDKITRKENEKKAKEALKELEKANKKKA